MKVYKMSMTSRVRVFDNIGGYDFNLEDIIRKYDIFSDYTGEISIDAINKYLRQKALVEHHKVLLKIDEENIKVPNRFLYISLDSDEYGNPYDLIGPKSKCLDTAEAAIKKTEEKLTEIIKDTDDQISVLETAVKNFDSLPSELTLYEGIDDAEKIKWVTECYKGSTIRWYKPDESQKMILKEKGFSTDKENLQEISFVSDYKVDREYLEKRITRLRDDVDSYNKSLSELNETSVCDVSGKWFKLLGFRYFEVEV